MLVGAAKSGSTSLYRMLAEHPRVFFPPSHKEPFYFCNEGEYPDQSDPIAVERMVWKTDEYLALYEAAPSDLVLVDGSTSYLYRYAESIRHMKEQYGENISDVRVIMILRDPVARAYSHYNFLKLNGFEEMPFVEALHPTVMQERKKVRWGFDYFGYGDYLEQVKAYRNTFPHCLILLTSDLRDSEALLERVTEFLGLDAFTPSEMVQANPSGEPRSKWLVKTMRRNSFLKRAVNKLGERQKHRILNWRDRMLKSLLTKKPIPKDAERILWQHYAKQVDALEDLIGRDLSAWKKYADHVRKT
jgi:hypothetical protein